MENTLDVQNALPERDVREAQAARQEQDMLQTKLLLEEQYKLVESTPRLQEKLQSLHSKILNKANRQAGRSARAAYQTESGQRTAAEREHYVQEIQVALQGLDILIDTVLKTRAKLIALADKADQAFHQIQTFLRSQYPQPAQVIRPYLQQDANAPQARDIRRIEAALGERDPDLQTLLEIQAILQAQAAVKVQATRQIQDTLQAEASKPIPCSKRAIQWQPGPQVVSR